MFESQSRFMMQIISSVSLLFNFALQGHHLLSCLPRLLTSLSVFSSEVHACGDRWHNLIISLVISEV